MTAEEYFNHSTNRVKPGDNKLTSVPPELCNKEPEKTITKTTNSANIFINYSSNRTKAAYFKG